MLSNATVFCDIDGVLIQTGYKEEGFPQFFTPDMGYMPNAVEGAAKQTLKWHREGYQIILTTGRPEYLREVTELTLRENHIFFDRMIMGVGCGPRVLINDTHDGKPKAYAINMERNQKLENNDEYTRLFP